MGHKVPRSADYQLNTKSRAIAEETYCIKSGGSPPPKPFINILPIQGKGSFRRSY